MIRRWLLLPIIGLLWLAPDARAADESAIRGLEAERNKGIAARDIKRLLALFSEDAWLLYRHRPIITGREAIRAFFTAFLATPGLSVALEAKRVEEARGADLAYVIGTYKMSWNDTNGRPRNRTGKYISVFRKEADGLWKIVAHASNPDSIPSEPDRTPPNTDTGGPDGP